MLYLDYKLGPQQFQGQMQAKVHLFWIVNLSMQVM
jgi:hypothetical protein